MFAPAIICVVIFASVVAIAAPIVFTSKVRRPAATWALVIGVLWWVLSDLDKDFAFAVWASHDVSSQSI